MKTLNQGHRFTQTVIRGLDDAAAHLPHETQQRLKVARERALQSKQRVRTIQTEEQTAIAWMNTGSGALGIGGGGFWSWSAGVLCLLMALWSLDWALDWQEEDRAQEIATLDAQLLTDDLPPEAYADPGFGQFLKASKGK